MITGKLVAVVEDDVALRDNYLAGLRRQGYRVIGYGCRKEALAGFANRLPDLVIIDVNLGAEVEGGFELCRELRARSAQLPIIFLTARESELDAVSGLRLGADDYLTKRTSLEHVLARVAALFRRVEALRSPEGPARTADRHRILGRPCSRPAPRAHSEPRAAHGGRERRARRRHRHLPDQANPGEVRRHRRELRGHSDGLRHGLSLAGRLIVLGLSA